MARESCSAPASSPVYTGLQMGRAGEALPGLPVPGAEGSPTPDCFCQIQRSLCHRFCHCGSQAAPHQQHLHKQEEHPYSEGKSDDYDFSYIRSKEVFVIFALYGSKVVSRISFVFRLFVVFGFFFLSKINVKSPCKHLHM